jgi:hypothetical protein
MSIKISIVVLMGAVIFVLIGVRSAPRVEKLDPALRDVLLRESDFGDWTTVELPVAETIELQKAVKEILNFDDAAYIMYENGAARVSVYVAFWPAGRMPQRLVASHTPDVCWVASGWEARSSSEVSLTLMQIANQRIVRLTDSNFAGHQTRDSARDTMVFQYRMFVREGREEYVVFCHFVGERVASYGSSASPEWYRFLADVKTWGLNQRQEQFFVRISSNRPLKDMLSMAPFQSAVLRLAEVIRVRN